MIDVVPLTKTSRIAAARLLAAGLAVLTLLSACASQEATPDPTPTQAPTATASASASPSASASASPSPSPSPSVKPATDLSAIQVSDGAKPEVKFAAPWAIASTTTKVLKPAEGTQKLTKDSVVNVNYVGVNGRTGEVFDSSYDKGSPISMSLAQVVPGFRLGLDGQTVGSRVLIGMPSSDGYPQGKGSSIQPGDSLLFVVDIISANFTEATGQPQTPAADLPKVTVGKDGVPSAAIDKTKEPPKELKVAPLIKGPGVPVGEQSVVQVKYRSWVWGTGAEFEDGWSPQTGRLTGLIEGWKQGLKGQTAGSRVLLVVPPALAYPEGRSTSPALQPGQTLVYVIDILDVQNP